MANPNLLGVTAIRGNTAYIAPSAGGAQTGWTYNGTTALTGLTPPANTIHRINSILVSNVSGANANTYLSISNNATWASGTAYYMAYNVTVPPGTTIVLIDKSSYFYVSENQSVAIQTSVGSALQFVASFEVLT